MLQGISSPESLVIGYSACMMSLCSEFKEDLISHIFCDIKSKIEMRCITVWGGIHYEMFDDSDKAVP